MPEAEKGGAAAPSLDEPALPLSAGLRLLVTFVVILASAAQNAATFTATAILPQMQGALAATEDEISWTVTFNILATAIAMPMTGWLVTSFGRRAVMIASLSGFTVTTLMCGQSGSLLEMVVWRTLQGAVSAPILPLGQTILLDIFPRRQHTMIIAVFGMTNTIGPVIGPTLGSYLAEHYSWRYAYDMIVPVGVLAVVGSLVGLPRDRPDERHGLDWLGFLALSVAIAGAQLVLSRGQRLDWYDSSEIVAATVIAALALYVFLVHSLTARKPFLNLALFRDRNFVVGLALISIFGMVNFTPMVVLPSLLQNHVGFTDILVGTVVSFRGMGVIAGFVGTLLMRRLDPRVTMVAGFSAQVASGLWLMSIDLNVGLETLCANAFLQGMAVGLIWAPVATITFWTIEPAYRSEAVSLFHLARSIASSFFIAISVAEIIRATGANYSRLTEQVSPYNRTLTLPDSIGGWSLDTLPGLARLAKEINRQASMIGYTNAFALYTAVSLIAIPMVFLIGKARARPR